jgi:hypothetical protein
VVDSGALTGMGPRAQNPASDRLRKGSRSSQARRERRHQGGARSFVDQTDHGRGLDRAGVVRRLAHRFHLRRSETDQEDVDACEDVFRCQIRSRKSPRRSTGRLTYYGVPNGRELLGSIWQSNRARRYSGGFFLLGGDFRALMQLWSSLGISAMPSGTVKWFNATKGYGSSSQTTAARMSSFTSRRSRGPA